MRYGSRPHNHRHAADGLGPRLMPKVRKISSACASLLTAMIIMIGCGGRGGSSTGPTTLPTVTIRASSSLGNQFDLFRAGSADAPLTVLYTVAAVPTLSPCTVPPFVTFPVGATTTQIFIFPAGATTATRTVTVTLNPDPAYMVGSPDSATKTVFC